MAKHQKSRGIPLPRGWPRRVKSAMLNVIALAQSAATYTRGWAIDGRIARLRLKAENDQLRQEVALLTEEMRIKDARMKRVDSQKRPHYMPTERMAILELRAARAWSAQQTAETFLVTAATIASWMKRVDEDGADALVQIREPVNKFPDFVRYAVQRLKALCPTLGKAKIAETLCRAGLHLGTTTVGRILKESPRPAPSQAFESTERVVTAKHANHVWHIDLTTVPTGVGFWAPWMPFALPQCWPFCWWLAVVVDHHSRRAMGFSIFPTRPTSFTVRSCLGRIIARVAHCARSSSPASSSTRTTPSSYTAETSSSPSGSRSAESHACAKWDKRISPANTHARRPLRRRPLPGPRRSLRTSSPRPPPISSLKSGARRPLPSPVSGTSLFDRRR